MAKTALRVPWIKYKTFSPPHRATRPFLAMLEDCQPSKNNLLHGHSYPGRYICNMVADIHHGNDTGHTRWTVSWKPPLIFYFTYLGISLRSIARYVK